MPSRRTLGLRGEVLLYIGFLWLLNGWFVYVRPVPSNRPPILHEMLPALLREGMWFATGIVAIVFAFQRWPGKDRWGFGALLIMPLQRALSWFASGLLGMAGYMEAPELPICFAQALVWGTTAWLIYRIGAYRQLLVVKHHQNGDTTTVESR